MSIAASPMADRGPTVFAVTLATLVLATVFVLARAYCRRFIVNRITNDDYIMGLAWLLAVGLAVSILLGVDHGLGRHDEDIVRAAGASVASWAILRKCQYVFSILYNPALMATKTSVLIFYLRLSENTQVVLRAASWVVLVIVNVAGVVLTIMNVFQCRPIDGAWNPWSETTKCIPLLTEFICATPVNIITDLAILALPLPVLTGMKLPPRQKTILVLTFCVGIFIAIVDVVRIYYLQQALNFSDSDRLLTMSSGNDEVIPAPFGGPAEYSYHASLAFMWSAVEVNISIVCACVPTLKPLIVRFLPAMVLDPNRSRAREKIASSIRSTARRISVASSRIPDAASRRTSVLSSPGKVVTNRRSTTEFAHSVAPTPASVPPSPTTTVISNNNNNNNKSSGTRTSSAPSLEMEDKMVGVQQSSDANSDSHLSSSTAPQQTWPSLFWSSSAPISTTTTTTSISTCTTNTTEGGFGSGGGGGGLGYAFQDGQANGPPTNKNVFFGFVNMSKPKSMLKCSVRESWKYCGLVTVLCLLWGMSYGFLNTLNTIVADLLQMSIPQTLGLTSVYFGGGYFFGPLLVGEWIVRRDEHRRSQYRKNRLRARQLKQYVQTRLQQQQQQQKHRSTRPQSLPPTPTLLQFHQEQPQQSRRSSYLNNNAADTAIGGFKATFILGLCIYGVGTMIFWPSAATQSYAGFMISHFVVGFGLAVLETAANAFIFLCGPNEYGELRLMLSQVVQSVGSTVASVLAQKVFFVSALRKSQGFSSGIGDVDDDHDANQFSPQLLLNFQWTYLAITMASVFLALFFYYMPLPEVSDGELERSTKRLSSVDPAQPSIGGFQLRTVLLALAVAAQWAYMGAQESHNIFFPALLVSLLPGQPKSGLAALEAKLAPSMLPSARETPSTQSSSSPSYSLPIHDYSLIGNASFTISRSILALLLFMATRHAAFPRPRTLLTITAGFSVLMAILMAALRPGENMSANPNLYVIPAILFTCFEGGSWPLSFALGLRGQGKRTKRAAAFLTMAASGPAVWPFVEYAVVVKAGASVQTAFIMVVVLQACMLVYPLVLDIYTSAHRLIDPHVLGKNPGGGGDGGRSGALFPDDGELGEDGGGDGREAGRRGSTLCTDDGSPTRVNTAASCATFGYGHPGASPSATPSTTPRPSLSMDRSAGMFRERPSSISSASSLPVPSSHNHTTGGNVANGPSTIFTMNNMNTASHLDILDEEDDELGPTDSRRHTSPASPSSTKQDTILPEKMPTPRVNRPQSDGNAYSPQQYAPNHKSEPISSESIASEPISDPPEPPTRPHTLHRNWRSGPLGPDEVYFRPRRVLSSS